MFRLLPSELINAESLFDGMKIHLGLYAILRGCIPGEVLVDNPYHPNAALASIHQKRFFVAGTPGISTFIEELRGYFAEVVSPKVKEKHEPAFLVFYTSGGWLEAFGEIFHDAELIKANRQYYVHTGLRNNWLAVLPPGFELRIVDKELLANNSLKNIDMLVEEMCSERASVEDFLQHSFGVCVVHHGEIAGMCLSEYNCLDRCEVGIATLEAYQQRGLATGMASALLEYALERGINQVGWHCYTRNIPSVATALKVGFTLQADYPVCIVRISPG